MSDAKSALRALGGDTSGDLTGLPNIPAVPSTDDYALNNILSSVKLWIEKASGSGLTGFASKQDLVRAGLIKTDSNGNVISNADLDLTIPPVPTGLVASGAMTTIIVAWDNPTNAYKNHAYTEIWAAETNNFTNAVMVGESGGFLFSHAVGEDSTRYYWIRFVSTAGIKGPFNSTNGTLGQTAKNPAYLLDTLTGQLTESQLYADLNSRINLIDGPSTTIGTIPYQLAQLQGQIDVLSNYPDYSGSTTYTTGDIVKYNGAIYKATQTTTGNLPTNTTYWLKIGDYSSLADAVAAHTTEIATLTSNDSAQASQITTLFSQVGTKSTIYRQPTAPTSPQLNDLWIDTSISYAADYFLDDYGIPRFKQYMWNGTQWILVTDDRIYDTQSALIVEQTTRASADTALSDQLTALTATVNGNNTSTNAAILAEQTARASADSALSTSITNLTATVSGNLATTNAAIAAEQTTRANADTALAGQITTLNATVVSNNNAIQSSLQTEQTTRASADSALAQDITTLTATVQGNQSSLSSAIQSEASTRASADSALTTQVNTAYSAATKTRTYSQNTAPTSGMIEGDLWFDADDGYKAYRYTGTAWVATDDTRISGNVAAIQSEASTRASADSALAGQITTLSATVEGYNSTLTSAIQNEANVRATSDGSLASQINTVAARLNSGGDVANAIVQSQTTANTAVANASAAQGTADSKIKTFFQTSAPTATTVGDLWIDTDDSNRIYRWNGATWADSADTRIAATASQVTTLQTTVAGHTTSIQTNATSINGLEGKYTVKIDNNGYVTGYGLASTANNGTPTSEFMVVADKFSIAPVATNPASADGSPFFYLTVPTVVDGVTVPAGAYMKTAYIADASITNAKIGNLSADKINAGYLAAERIGTNTITADKINGNNLAVVNGTFSGLLSAATGTFAGSLSAATGTFAGRLAAGVLDPSAFAGVTYTYATPGTYTVTVPNNSSWTSVSARITLQGAGGGGGGAQSAGYEWAAAGGGGGAGTLAVITLANLTPGATYTLYVGAGGVAGYASGSGGNGEATSFAGYSGAGGIGGGGAIGIADGRRMGSGGSIGGTSGWVDAWEPYAGNGGSSVYGSGGLGAIITDWVLNRNGANGGVASGGGGGAAARSGGNGGYAYGGAGGGGYAMIEFFDPNSVVTNTRYSNLVAWLDTIGHGSVPSNAR